MGSYQQTAPLTACRDGLIAQLRCLQAKMDLVNVGQDVETEKDFCLERFMEWAKVVCEKIASKGHWADYIDPCSGLPMVTKWTFACALCCDCARPLSGHPMVTGWTFACALCRDCARPLSGLPMVTVFALARACSLLSIAVGTAETRSSAPC